MLVEEDTLIKGLYKKKKKNTKTQTRSKVNLF